VEKSLLRNANQKQTVFSNLKIFVILKQKS
jgi:hypothetical protein